jgi:hypothetical protein
MNSGLYDNVSLLLNHAWLPHGFITKRRCIELMVRESKVDALDSTFNRIPSVEWFDLPTDRMFDNPVRIESAKRSYPLPSIVIVNDKFMTRNTIMKSNVSFDDMCRLFRNKCQNCGGKFRRKDLSIEHIDPVSKSHNNEDFNLTLTCKKCNREKADIENWLTPQGEKLKGITIKDYVKMKFYVDNYRDEWGHFFIKAH